MESRTAAPKSSSFAVDVFKLVSGTTIAQGLMVLAAPLLARLYTPEDFGALALYLSITSIVGVIACLRYELAIMLPESDEEAANLLAVSLGFSLVVTCLTTLVIGWGGETVLGWLNAPGLKPYLWLIPVTVLLDGVFQALNYWNSRTKQFGRLSIARVTSSAATVSTQLGAGYAGYATGGSLIGANVVGKTISTAVLGGQIWRDDRSTFWKAIRWRGMARGIKRYQKFPKYSIWTIFFNQFSRQLPIFMFGIFFDSIVVGLYAFSHRILTIPSGLVGYALSQVFYQKASSENKNGNISLLVESVCIYLWMLGFYPFFLLSLLGKDIFIFLFGQEWADAGLYSQVLGIWIFFMFIHSPFSSLFSVLEAQKSEFFFNILLFFIRILSLTLGGLMGRPLIAIFIYSFSSVLFIICITYWLFLRCKVKLKKLCIYLLKYIYFGLVSISIPFLSKLFFRLSEEYIFIFGCLSIIVYYLLVFRNHNKAPSDILMFHK